MLAKEAENWWEFTQRQMEHEQQVVNRASFKDKFLYKYFPADMKTKKEMEFLRLQHGNMLVGEYVVVFEDLERFSNSSQQMQNRQGQCEVKECCTEECYSSGKFLRTLEEFGSESWKGKAFPSPQDTIWISIWKSTEIILIKQQQPQQQQKQSFQTGNSSNNSPPWCSKCKGKNFGANCPICYHCNQLGHIKSVCPKLKKEGVNAVWAARPQAEGRVFTMSGAEIKEDEDLIQDIILGVDWQSNNHVLLNCFNKTAVFCNPQDPIEPRYETKSTIANQMEKFLKEGAQVFMMLASLEKKEGGEIHSIPVVRNFSDVFPDDIPGLPPVREIEFAIDLAPRTGPISIAPYRMAPLELTELKKHCRIFSELGYWRIQEVGLTIYI
ncbi:PREDICTED: uncharacterized protein LOC109327003 [Lupinus angustifolius]|uniref:uncharacterized protein LOC109327003 n=1 Tax=Lupinus angustifolius TaxID=3871 RepID=UPI00092E2B87|nr:PREDICTED: uncharacterized protein LOC109327003 [Lupinus angustifolius]